MMRVLAGTCGRRRLRADDIGANGADQPHIVADDLISSPLLERLVDINRVAEIDRAGEVLLRAVEAVQRGALFGPQDAVASAVR